jgi:hypothetical protein
MQKLKGRVLAPNLEDGSSVKQSEPAANVSLKDTQVTVRRARYTLSGLVVSVLAANDYGSAKIMDLPFRNMLLLGIEADLVLTKAGTTNGLVAATDLDVAIGTAPASAITLASTMIDIIEKKDLDADSLTAIFQAHTNDQATAVFPKKIVDDTNAALYLNVGVAAGITANDSLSASGTIDIFYVDLGKLV